MADMRELNMNEMEQATGGVYRTVNTGDSRDAAIRSYPGLNAPVIATLPNGTVANSTGSGHRQRPADLGRSRRTELCGGYLHGQERENQDRLYRLFHPGHGTLRKRAGRT